MYIKVFLACYNNIHHTASKCAVAGFDKYNAFDVLIILCIGMLLPGTPWVCTKLSASPALCAPNSYLGSPKLSQKPSSVWRRTWVYFLCCLWFSEANFYNIFIFNLGSQMLQNSFVNILCVDAALSDKSFCLLRHLCLTRFIPPFVQMYRRDLV